LKLKFGLQRADPRLYLPYQRPGSARSSSCSSASSLSEGRTPQGQHFLRWVRLPSPPPLVVGSKSRSALLLSLAYLLLSRTFSRRIVIGRRYIQEPNSLTSRNCTRRQGSRTRKWFVSLQESRSPSLLLYTISSPDALIPSIPPLSSSTTTSLGTKKWNR